MISDNGPLGSGCLLEILKFRRYSKEFCTEIKESTLSTWKSKCLNEIKERHKERAYDKSGEIVVSSLPSKKRGRPLLLGDKLDKQVQSYVRATRDGKGDCCFGSR